MKYLKIIKEVAEELDKVHGPEFSKDNPHIVLDYVRVFYIQLTNYDVDNSTEKE